MLRIRDLKVSYGDVVAISDIDLDLASGETIALLGRSGSGKTTVLKAIAGLVRLDAGAIELDGMDLTGVPTHRRHIGMVFQDFALFPHLDVGENIAYGLRMSGTERIDERVDAVLDLVGLAGYRSRRIDQLSGGQAQRVALARTLAPEPGLLLLDEPLGSLDPDLRTTLAGELDTLLHRTGVPTIVVTHDTAEAFALGDRVAIIVDGRIAVSGAPNEVWREPHSVEAARLVGHRNLVPTLVSDGIAVVGDVGIPVRAPDGPTTLLVRPGSISTPGPMEATVVSSRYRGPDWVLTVTLGDGAVEVPHHERSAPGAMIGVAIHPEGVTTVR